MNNKDHIKPFERFLMLHFKYTGQTQQLTTLKMDQGITLMKDGLSIKAAYNEGPSEPFVLETFSCESHVNVAFTAIQTKLLKYARHRRLAHALKSGVKWVLLPFMVFVMTMAFNIAYSTKGNNLPTPQAAPAITSNEPTSMAPNTPSPSELAKALKDGLSTGKFSVSLSSTGKETLFVFSDPNCSHCKTLEPELEKLSKYHAVHVFPVSVVSGDSANKAISTVLCTSDKSRSSAWKKLIAEGQSSDTNTCQTGEDAVLANNQIFRGMRFKGTPTLINAQGQEYPDNLPNTAESIGQWLEASPKAAP